MPLPNTRADALQIYHTGAGSHGDAQADPDDSLGGFRSSTRSGNRGFLIDSSAIQGLTIDFVSASNGEGLGALTAVDADELAWTAPGSETRGAAVQILPGEQRLLEDGDDQGKYILVTRLAEATYDLAGSCAVRVLDVLNNVVGQANADIETGPTYRAIALVAGSATVRNLLVWIQSADHPVQIADQAPASQPNGDVQTIADEETAPTGVSFVAPDGPEHVDVITIAELKPGEWHAIWIERDLSAETDATPLASIELGYSFRAVG